MIKPPPPLLPYYRDGRLLLTIEIVLGVLFIGIKYAVSKCRDICLLLTIEIARAVGPPETSAWMVATAVSSLLPFPRCLDHDEITPTLLAR